MLRDATQWGDYKTISHAYVINYEIEVVGMIRNILR